MFKKAAVYTIEKINKNGLTFAEMLFAVLILGIATGLMAQTVGVAFNNFEKITKNQRPRCYAASLWHLFRMSFCTQKILKPERYRSISAHREIWESPVNNTTIEP